MFGPPPPADTAHVAQARTDAADGVNFPVRATADRAPYLAVMRGTPGILEVMDYANLAQGYRIGIWDAIDDYDVDGTAAPAYPSDSNWPTGSDQNGMPPGYDKDNVSGTAPPFYYDATTHQTTVLLTEQQAIDSFGAKVAHAVYHEAQGTFPWKISSYSNVILEGLLDPTQLYNNGSGTSYWDEGGDPAAAYYFTIDHVPQEAYDTATSFWGTPATPLEAIANIQDNALQDTNHVSLGVDPLWAIKLADVFYPADRVDWISRWGCHTAATICMALARSINIPALIDRNYMDGGGHATVHFPSINRSWIHGDDIYNTDENTYRGLATAGYYSEWVANVAPTTRLTWEARRETLRLHLMRGMDTPHPDLVRNYNNGVDGLKSNLSFYEAMFSLPSEQGIIDQVYSLAKKGAGIAPGDEPSDLRAYGRLEIYTTDQNETYKATPTWGATGNYDYPCKGNYLSTARVKQYTVVWENNDPEEDVLPNDVVSVVEDQTTTVGPHVRTQTTIEINFQVPWLGAGFEITPNPLTGTGTYADEGDGSLTMTIYRCLPDGYTIEWQDNLAGYNPPSPATEGPKTLTTDNTISFAAPTYVAE